MVAIMQQRVKLTHRGLNIERFEPQNRLCRVDLIITFTHVSFATFQMDAKSFSELHFVPNI